MYNAIKRSLLERSCLSYLALRWWVYVFCSRPAECPMRPSTRWVGDPRSSFSSRTRPRAAHTESGVIGAMETFEPDVAKITLSNPHISSQENLTSSSGINRLLAIRRSRRYDLRPHSTPFWWIRVQYCRKQMKSFVQLRIRQFKAAGEVLLSKRDAGTY